MRYLYILLGVLFLSGCRVYDKYTYTTTNDESFVDTSSIAFMSWRELFADPCLQRLIDTALVRNVDIKTAQLRVSQAEAMLQSARLSYLPSVGLTAQGGVTQWDGSTVKDYSLGGNFSWELDVFGRITAAKRESLAILDSNLAYEQAVKTGLISTVASAYYTLLLLDEQYAISKKTSDNWAKTVKTLQTQMRAGMVNEVAVLQADANRMMIDSYALSVENSINEAENALNLLLMQSPSKVERGSLSVQNFPDNLSKGVSLQLVANRPDVRQTEYDLVRSFYATNVARSAFYPSLTLSGLLGWTNNGGMVDDPGEWLINVVASLTQPLFNQGVNVANLKVAKAEQEMASLAFSYKLLEAGNEVNNALMALQTAKDKLKLDLLSVEVLQETVRKTELLMKYSSTSYLEVLTAQQSLLSAEQSLVQDRFDEIKSVIDLYHALGGGAR